MSTVNPTDLARQVIAEHPDASKDEWGDLLRDAASAEGMDSWLDAMQSRALAKFVGGVYAGDEKAAQAERELARSVGHSGRLLISPTISIRTEHGGSQQQLWYEATPLQFITAVMREQNVASGRIRSNGARLAVVKVLQANEDLLQMPTLQAVMEHLGLDPETLSLDELTA